MSNENQNPLDLLGATEAQYNAARAKYDKKNPKATSADIARFNRSWGPLTRTAASGAVAAKSCKAVGTWEQWIFFALCVAIFLAVAVVIPAVYRKLWSRGWFGSKRESEPSKASDQNEEPEKKP